MDFGLKGRVAIVAAASKGLGRAAAEELSKEGCEVAICARTSADLERTATEIAAANGRAIFWRVVDVTKPQAVASFVEEVEKRFSRIDICITNAGGPPSKKFADISLEEWRSAVDLTLLSNVFFAREVLPRMQRRKWGRFITITSVSVVVALMVGGIEALGLLVGRFHLKGNFWDAVARLNDNFGALGFFIVGLFALCWAASVAFYKWRRFDDLELGT